jgi:hypothetical protein
MLMRVILIAHRYMAVAVGLMIALWCLSGFVMMYQGYPAFTQAERLHTLAPINLAGCCSSNFLPDDATPLTEFRIEMLRGDPVLRQPGMTPINLRTNMPVDELHQSQLLDVAADHARLLGIRAQPHWMVEVPIDQWTIQTAGRNQPAHRLMLGDSAGTEIYVNAATGEIFQDTNRQERVLSWFGAIPHWLYPTVLRRNGELWSQVVIWISTIGTFLTATGLYAGIVRWRRRRKPGSSISPFRGWWYWHHVLGLVFGVLSLTWIFSGLMTMSPWGLLDGSNIGARVVPQIRGAATTAELRRFLQSAPAALTRGEFRQLRGESFGGQLQVVALRADGTSLRLDAAAKPNPLQAATIERVVRQLDTGVAQFERLDQGDDYYYAHKSTVELPVYRAILDDDQHTRLYIGATTGVLNLVDVGARRTRWFERALHGLDFRALRARPLWDIVTLLLLAGVTALAITGAWMALKRIRADLSPRT